MPGGGQVEARELSKIIIPAKACICDTISDNCGDCGLSCHKLGVSCPGCVPLFVCQ